MDGTTQSPSLLGAGSSSNGGVGQSGSPRGLSAAGSSSCPGSHSSHRSYHNSMPGSRSLHGCSTRSQGMCSPTKGNNRCSRHSVEDLSSAAGSVCGLKPWPSQCTHGRSCSLPSAGVRRIHAASNQGCRVTAAAGSVAPEQGGPDASTSMAGGSTARKRVSIAEFDSAGTLTSDAGAKSAPAGSQHMLNSNQINVPAKHFPSVPHLPLETLADQTLADLEDPSKNARSPIVSAIAAATHQVLPPKIPQHTAFGHHFDDVDPGSTAARGLPHNTGLLASTGGGMGAGQRVFVELGTLGPRQCFGDVRDGPKGEAEVYGWHSEHYRCLCACSDNYACWRCLPTLATHAQPVMSVVLDCCSETNLQRSCRLTYSVVQHSAHRPPTKAG